MTQEYLFIESLYNQGGVELDFKKVVDTIIPRTPGLAKDQDSIMMFGALDFQTDAFVILSLNSYTVPLAEPTAELLGLLEEAPPYQNELPTPFQNNPWLITFIMSSLVRTTMMGYYSEWYGYGTSRLLEPNQRKFEFKPVSWAQVGYPGTSFSYRTQVMDYYKRRRILEP